MGTMAIVAHDGGWADNPSAMKISSGGRERVRRPAMDALLAAGLFGMSAPLAKLLLGTIHPLPLAAILYLGAGLGLSLYLIARRPFTTAAVDEARLERGDLPWLAGATISGGVIAPILLLYGLRTTPAATASLLLSLEIVATALIAGAAFREFIGRSTWSAILMITGGSVLLSLDPSSGWGVTRGAALIVAACFMWGLDNNLTRHISLKDPKLIVAIKGLTAGGVSLSLALALRRPFPGAGGVMLGLLLGGLSYGISIALFVRALRGMGAARTGALFGTAPFLGAAASLMIFRDHPSASFLSALPILAIGAGILYHERHEHVHTHPLLTHTHAHAHTDNHHEHAHAGQLPASESHSHRHTHPPIEHAHPHRPDIHHRHKHSAKEGKDRLADL